MSAGACPSGKARYKDRLSARMALAFASRKHADNNRPKTERRIYRCPACQGWHLTSRR